MSSRNGETTVLELGGLHWASSQAVVDKMLSRRPGVLGVTANAVSQTATVTYDPARIVEPGHVACLIDQLQLSMVR